MTLLRLLFIGLLSLISATGLSAQENPQPPNGSQETRMPQLQPGSAHKTPGEATPQAATPQIVPLIVPRETSLQVALDEEVRVKKVGQQVTARLVDPIYAFDKLVVPVGSEIRGQITKIEPISTARRTLAGLDADFTPARKVEVTFNDLVLPDGKDLPLHTSVTPGSGQVLQFVSAPDKDPKKSVKDLASEKTNQAKQQARDQWNSAMKQLKTPGRVHRLKRYAEAQLPVHAQYIPAGSVYFAELEDPLNFGSEVLRADQATTIGSELPAGSVVHARLLTALSSATAKKGEPVEAVLARPLFDGDHLLFPQGSQLLGSVGQVQPARRLKRNGQLRISFHQVTLPDGVQQKVEAALVGVQAAKDGNVKLDSEGGAEATTPKTRYLNTTISLGLAAISGRGDEDAKTPNAAGTTGGRMAGGIGGFKVVGLIMGVAVQSHAFGYAMGAYGAGRSVYQNFLTRGQEVVFPKNTAMDISLGTRREP